VLGERKVDYFDYYMECDINPSTGQFTGVTDFTRVEPYRHGLISRSNVLYLDFHVDNRIPVKLDPTFVDPWQVRAPVQWGVVTTTPPKTP
jgi:prepilin-type processing-associated H-X9-DG protein